MDVKQCNDADHYRYFKVEKKNHFTDERDTFHVTVARREKYV